MSIITDRELTDVVVVSPRWCLVAVLK